MSCKHRGFAGNEYISVYGAICLALFDTGCSHGIVHAPYCASWTIKRSDVMTVSGQRQHGEGVDRIQLRVCNGDSMVVGVYVVDFMPLGFEFILGQGSHRFEKALNLKGCLEKPAFHGPCFRRAAFSRATFCSAC